LKKIASIIARYSNIESALSIQPQQATPTSLMFTLPLAIDSEQLQKLVTRLEKKGFTVTSIEDLQRFN